MAIHPLILQSAGVLALCAAALGAAAGDFAALVRSCDHCHGTNGLSTTPDVPIIAGFSREGFVRTLDAFRSGERVAPQYRQPGEPATTMHEIAEKLGDAEVQQLAEHYAGLPFVAATQAADPALAKHGELIHQKVCEKCHTDGGAHPVEDAAILAGQWTPYLRRQFDNVAADRREVPTVMQQRIAAMKPHHIEALLAFYAANGARATSP
jgi:sulfide dehydrogenase cytochrome subunit